jgi:hypothetical protein
MRQKPGLLQGRRRVRQSNKHVSRPASCHRYGLGGGNPLLGKRQPTGSRDKATAFSGAESTHDGTRTWRTGKGPPHKVRGRGGDKGRMFVSKAAMWCFLLETKVGPARRVGARRALLSSPGGLMPPPRAPPRPGADVCFIGNEVIFFRKQRSLSLDRTRVRLKTHPYRLYYRTCVLCCQVQDVSRNGLLIPPHYTK